MLAGFGVLVAPLVEELFFRGFIYPALARWTGAAPSVIITAAGFALTASATVGSCLGASLLILLLGGRWH